MPAVMSIGFCHEPNEGMMSFSASSLSRVNGPTDRPDSTHWSAIRMPPPPEMVTIATRLPAGRLPHSNTWV